MKKEKWEKPKLIVLVRSEEEAVLGVCKVPAGSGPDFVDIGCIYYPCGGECLSSAAS